MIILRFSDILATSRNHTRDKAGNQINNNVANQDEKCLRRSGLVQFILKMKEDMR